jgi:hypothetical protein
MPKQQTLSPHDARKVAVWASTDPRTVLRFVNGQPMRSTTADRVKTALERLRTDAQAEAAR